MGVNKVVFGAVSIMDISDSTVTPATLLKGVTAYDAKGEKITGTFETDKKVVEKSGTMTVSDQRDSITINTGLDEICAIRIVGSDITHKDGDKYTREWTYNSDLGVAYATRVNVSSITIGGNTSLLAATYAHDGYITIDGGTVIANKIDSDSLECPIFAGTYNWYAVGTQNGTMQYVTGTVENSAVAESFAINTELENVTGVFAYCENNGDGHQIVWWKIGEENNGWYISSSGTTGKKNNAVAISGSQFSISQIIDSIQVPAGTIKYTAWGTGSGSGDTDINLQTKTVTPSALQQIIKPDNGYDGLGQVTVAGDSDLVASNIKNGVNIFGVTGNYTGSASSGGSGNCEAYIINPANPAVDFDRADGEIKVWGYGYYESSGGWMNRTTVYAFAGDKYYTSGTYGDPTETRLNVSVSNGQLTGFPELTGGSLLVTKGV